MEEIEQLIKGCLSQERKAQEQLYRSYYGFAMSICLSYSKSKTEAEEIADDGFIKVFTKLESYDGKQSFKAWVRRIMINTAIDYFRSQKKHYNMVDIENAPEFSGFDDNIISDISAAEIMTVIQDLPPAYQMVFSLHVLEGYKHHEIAKRLNITEGTSKSNFFKAKNKLKEKLSQANISRH